uniref:Uncharacterized protein n=1 Tax=Oryza barthii TaxID=65489 RepID=A0A0D3H8K3_9ORYZ
MVASPRHLLVPVQFAAELVALGHQPLYPLAPAPAPTSRRHQLRRTAGRAAAAGSSIEGDVIRGIDPSLSAA